MSWIPLHQTWQIYWQIYIAQCTYSYSRLTPPPHISVIYITLHIDPCQIDPTPTPLEHRSLENHCTKEVSYIAQFTYIYDRLTPPPPAYDHRSMEDHYTTSVSHLAYCTDTLGRLMGCNCVPWTYGRLTSSNWAQMLWEYHYTKLGRSASITTSSLIDYRSMEDHHTESVSWQTDPTPSSNRA